MRLKSTDCPVDISMAKLEIFLVILGDAPTSEKMFLVSAPGNMSVGGWKNEVYNARRNDCLKGYGAADLTLWKVRPLHSLHRPMC
jgi:hypothetical protein